MPRKDRKSVQLAPEAHAAFLAFQRELRDLHVQGVIQLPPGQEDWPSASYTVMHLLERVKAHRGRAKKQRARKAPKPAAAPEGKTAGPDGQASA